MTRHDYRCFAFRLKHLVCCFRNNILIPLLSVTVLNAQPFKTTLYTTNDGLPGAFCFGVYEDSFGYLWINTTNGLSRYDGKQFVNISSEGKNASVLLEDSRHFLWVVSSEGMGKLVDKKIIVYPLSDTLKFQYFFKIVETKEKKIWALTEKGVYQFEDTIWKKISLYPGYENFHCRQMIECDSGIYVNYGDQIVFRDQSKKWKVIADNRTYNTSFFNGMSEYNGQVFVSTNSSIFVLENNRLISLINGFKGRTYFVLFIDSKKRLWYVFQEGDSYFHVVFPGHKSEGLRIPNYYGQVGSINEDSHGNIWIGTSEGLVKITEAPFATIREDENSILGRATNAIFLADSTMFLCSHDGFYHYFPGKSQEIGQCTELQKAEGPIDCFLKDNGESLWFITRSGKMFCYNKTGLRNVSKLIKAHDGEYFKSATYQRNKNRMFFCGNSTLLTGDKNHLDYFIPTNTGKPVMECSDVLSLKGGQLLVLISEKGIFCIDRDDSLTMLWKNQSKNLSGNLYEDEAGNIWLSENGIGLREFSFKKDGLQLINIISEKNGLQNNTVYSLASDIFGRIWVVTASGLDVLQKNKDQSWIVYNYGRDVGLTLSNSSLTRLSADPKGDIWLTSWHEMVKFDVHKIQLRKEIPKIIIEKILVNSAEVDWIRYTDSLSSYQQFPIAPKLKYSQNTISLNFNAICFSSFPRLEYSYQLNPIDTSWSLPNTNNSVSFVKMPPGNYVFKVKARNQASGWSEPAVFYFSIASPFWVKGWFISLVILAVLLIFLSIYRYRINQLKKLLSIRTKISRDLHDEIGSTLTSINILSKVSRSNLDKDHLKVSDLLQKISEQSANMQQSMSDIVWSIRPDNDKLENLIIRMREYLGHTAEQKNILVEFFADEKILNKSLSMKRRQHVFLIYKEAVNNAVKYSQGKKISVFFVKEENLIKLSIKDDGLGFDTGKITSSSGLKNMYQRAKELKGNLHIISSPGKGTEISLLCTAT